ncbi:MAG TPA: alpha/beta fold hydrolase [Longimicrobiaceae bacterium]|jgi:dienelactone hydrolase
MRSTKAVAAAALAGAALLGCDGGPVERGADPRLTLAPDSVVVGVFESAPLVATVRDAGGAPRYVSRDPGVATVSAGGVVGAVAVGSTYVVASLPDRPDVRDSVRVRVHADSCSGARPDFGGTATAADRSLFGYDADAPLDLQKTVESTNDGVEASSISFSSPDGGRVTGMMWDPVTRPGLRPGMVVMHGLPGKARDFAGLGENYARNGAAVIAIDAPWNRRAAPPYLTITAQDRAEQIQVVRDLQRAVDVLRSRPNVDAGRIAFVGFSWGGATGALFVGIERRLKAAALVVGHGGQVSHATGPEGFKLISGFPCARRVAWIRAMAPVEPIRFVGHANVPLLLQNGTSDEFIPVADAAELHAAAPRPKEVRWYAAGHSLTPQAGADRYDWLVEKIGIDPRQPAPTGSE